MKTRFYVLLLILSALLDDFLSLYIPADFRYQSYSFVPHFCFAAMLVIVCSRDWKDRLLIGSLVGILTDYFFTISFPTYFILYALLAFASGLLYQFMDDSRLQAAILWGISLFVDLIPYWFYHLIGKLNVSFGMWFLHFETATLIVNAIAVCLMVYVVHVYDRYQMIQSVRQKKADKRKIRNLKLSRK